MGKLAPIVLSLLAADCSLFGLDEGLERRSCLGEPASFCDELNASHPASSECMKWSCARSSGFCEVLALDADHDGAPADTECLPSGTTADCDDGDAALAPGAQEVCDGADNDCDGLADEDLFEAGEPVVVAGTSEAVTSVAYAPTAGGESLGIAFRYDTDAQTAPRAALLTSVTMAGVVSEVSVVRGAAALPGVAADDLGLAALSGGGYAFAMAPSGCERLVVGRLDESGGDIEARFADTMYDRGLANAETTCPEGGGPVMLPVLSALGDAFVAVWVQRDGTDDFACSVVSASPVLAKAAIVNEDGLVVVSTSGSTLVSQTTDTNPPAVVAVDGVGWLIATASRNVISATLLTVDEDGALRLDGSTRAVTRSSSSEPLVEPVLTLGGRSGSVQQLTLAFTQGCGGVVQLGVVRVELDVSTYALTAPALPVFPAQLLGIGGEMHRPALAWQPEPIGWLLGWRDSLEESVNVVRLGEDLTPVDSAPISVAGDLPDDALPIALNAMPDGRTFTAIGHRRSGATPGFFATAIGCGVSGLTM